MKTSINSSDTADRTALSVVAGLLLYTTIIPAFAHDDHIAHIRDSVSWDTVAVKSGSWHDPAVWSTNDVPAPGANVRIPSGFDVKVGRVQNEPLARILVEGKLRFVRILNSKLVVDTLLVDRTGRFEAGTEASPLKKTAEIVIQAHPSVPLEAAMGTRGIMVSGSFETNGVDRYSRARLAGDARRGSSTLSLRSPPPGWAVGDEIVVTGTYFRPLIGRGDSQIDPPLENEVRRITAVSGTTLTLDAPLAYDHVRAESGFSIYITNLTRPIKVRSAVSSPLDSRGHVMFMEGARVRIHDAAFIDLGRSDKTRDVDDASNLRGAYSLHFHRTGYDQVQVVDNSVFRGTPGWGLVNHSSNVQASWNVAHDFVGAAFVSEAGDEIGSFIGNTASGGTQRPDGPKPWARDAVTAEQQDRLRAGDMGRGGNAFWLVSPQVEVRDNVVAGSNGTAYFFFGVGMMENGIFTGFPLDRFPAGITPRTWKEANQFNGKVMGLSADLPVKDFRNNIAYGVFQGLRVRWTNDTANWLIRSSHGVQVGDQYNDIPVSYGFSTLSNLTFWNVASGATVGYSGFINLDNLTVVNAPGYAPDCSNATCEVHGYSAVDGNNGSTAELRNSRIGNFALAIAKPETQRVINTTVDGKPYRD
jgi:hypothetical protein